MVQDRKRLNWVAGAVVFASLLISSLPVSAKGPESLSGLAENVMDAVVNISASTNGNKETPRTLPLPQLPPGSPLEDFFNDLLGPRGENAPKSSPRSDSLGSGFVIDPSGIVVTNNHVIGDADDITVVFNDGKKLKAEIIGKDEKVDIAVLRVKPEQPLKAVPFGDSDKLKIGDWVMAIGNPFGLGGSVSAGIVSARNRDIDDQSYGQYIQTDAAINKGNSGGPLFNMNGEVIGINTAILSPTGGSVGIGFAVPSSMAAPVVAQLREFGETRRGWLGVRIQPIDEQIAESLGLGEQRGALIAGVDENGPSKSAGIEAGDVVISFDGKPVKDSRDLPRLVGQTAVGKEVDVVVLRKGKEQTVKVKLGRLDEGQKTAKAPDVAPIPSPKAKSVLGIEIETLSDELRKKFSIKDTVKGVVVTRVAPNTAAAEKRIAAGDVVVEVQQQAVDTPDLFAKRVEAVKKEGKKSVLLMMSNTQGEMRFVALPLD